MSEEDTPLTSHNCTAVNWIQLQLFNFHYMKNGEKFLIGDCPLQQLKIWICNWNLKLQSFWRRYEWWEVSRVGKGKRSRRILSPGFWLWMGWEIIWSPLLYESLNGSLRSTLVLSFSFSLLFFIFLSFPFPIFGRDRKLKLNFPYSIHRHY